MRSKNKREFEEDDSVEIAFDRSRHAPRVIRSCLAELLTEWGIDGLQKENAQLIASEIVSNVVRHTPTGGVFRAQRTPYGVRVEITDQSSSPAIPRHAHPRDSSGRGMIIIDELASSWGSKNDGATKTIWFDIHSS